MSKITASFLAAALAASPLLAQPRGPVVPNFQQPEKQAPQAAAPVAPASDIDLVGPTAAQQARAKAATDAKTRAEAEARAAAEQKAKDEAAAKLRAQAESMARADAEAKAKSEAEAKARADAAEKARLEAQSKEQQKQQAQADALAARRRSVDEARARAKAAVDAAKQKALDAELARRRALEDARAAARAAVDAQKKLKEEAAAQAREEARARKADAEEKAKSHALLLARKRDLAKCGKGKKAQKCLAAVAAKYDAPSLPMGRPAAPAEPLALAPLIAPPPAAAPVAPAAPAVAVAPAVPAARAAVIPGAPVAAAPSSSGDRRVVVPADAPAPGSAAVAPKAVTLAPAAPAPIRPVSSTPGPLVASSGSPAGHATAVLAVPRDEQPRRPRSAEVTNDLQLGPQSLILDNLFARGELLPGALQLDFGYRFAIDDAAAPHHLFLAGLESGRCLPGDACGLRWFLRGGLGPHNASDFRVDRRINGTMGAHRDTLGWAANVAQAGLGYSGATVSVLADAQLESLTAEYLRNVDLAGPPRVNGSLKQLRLRGALGLQSGGFTAQARLATYSYSGDPTAAFKDVPMRGALLEDDMPGLAGALQSLSARLEARWESAGGFALAGSYGYLSYVGPVWSAAHIFAGNLSQRFGRFRVGLGIVAEQETDAHGDGFPTVFGTGSLGASF